MEDQQRGDRIKCICELNLLELTNMPNVCCHFFFA